MTTTTLAAVAHGAGEPFTLEEVELDDLRPDEVLVDVVAVGMCHTDISAGHGTIPFPTPGVLGHEGAGRVSAVGSEVHRVRPGDPVLMSFTSCGRCTACRGGHPAYCDSHLPWNLLGGRRADGSSTIRRPDGTELSGHFFGQSSFAHQAIVDERSLVLLEPDTTDDDLIRFAPLGCGVQTGAGAVINVLRPTSDTVMVVTGAGAVGLAAVMAAAALSVGVVIVVDRVAERLELALELGATHSINAEQADTTEELRKITQGRGVDAAIETTGNVGVLEMAIESLAIGGSCFVIGAPPAGSRASFNVNAQLPGRRIVGVTLGDSEPERFIPQLIALHRAGRFPFDRLARRYPFSEINRAAEDAARGVAIKPVLVIAKGPQ
ncbi:NAD(P)-dependent alcohol dehydrogenase [Kribbella qitaiheensis]|uniref:NAD(P)-dependent alcohol dehydrogenase n=2 Tax=Kribbella qitaiheensis TaxID=1544730 RepID=A0A7G6X531_9ACTN|nr:NAD(P)-dependent alcohol dehydrogenase [Kribbella qitaiheensis]QNE21346.1 NAD(P)-dependent alcohol dehydrogenase [Kribbella qitaiheensis]